MTKEEFDRQIAAIDDLISKVIVDRTEAVHVQDVLRLIFDYDASRIRGGSETHSVMESSESREVLGAFIPKILSRRTVTYEQFREAAKQTQKETGKKGKELFHPIRVAVTGEVSGLELEKLIPLIERWSAFELGHPVKSVGQRLREFAAVAGLAEQSGLRVTE